MIEDDLARRLATDDLPLMSNISTDEITPGWVCFYYDETLGQYVYVGMRDGAVKRTRSRTADLPWSCQVYQRAAGRHAKPRRMPRSGRAFNW